MGVIKDKLNSWVKKATETATETVKQIAQEDAQEKLDILEGIGKLILLGALTIGAIKGTQVVSNVVSVAKASEVIEPIAHTAQAAAPVVQIFLGEGKGVHIE